MGRRGWPERRCFGLVFVGCRFRCRGLQGGFRARWWLSRTSSHLCHTGLWDRWLALGHPSLLDFLILNEPKQCYPKLHLLGCTGRKDGKFHCRTWGLLHFNSIRKKETIMDGMALWLRFLKTPREHRKHSIPST